MISEFPQLSLFVIGKDIKIAIEVIEREKNNFKPKLNLYMSQAHLCDTPLRLLWLSHLVRVGS